MVTHGDAGRIDITSGYKRKEDPNLLMLQKTELKSGGVK